MKNTLSSWSSQSKAFQRGQPCDPFPNHGPHQSRTSPATYSQAQAQVGLTPVKTCLDSCPQAEATQTSQVTGSQGTYAWHMKLSLITATAS